MPSEVQNGMQNKIQIVDLKSLSKTQHIQAAQLLVDELPLGWESLDEAMYEVNDRWAIEKNALFFAAVSNDEVIGWCGILPHYDGKVYELHPLVVRRDRQRKGVGAMLVNAAADAARKKGGLTLWLGADDDKNEGETSLSNVDLFDDLPRRIKDFEPGTHQSAFYLKLGFKIIGVMPNANGLGKPDIFLAKRL